MYRPFFLTVTIQARYDWHRINTFISVRYTGKDDMTMLDDDPQRDHSIVENAVAYPKKRTRTARKQQLVADQAPLASEGPQDDVKKKRAPRGDKGLPRLEERDLIVLRWMMQMYAVRFDQLQVLLARHSPKKDELQDPEHVSGSTVRTHLARWKRLKLVEFRKIYAGKDDPLWCWLSSYGLNYLANEEDEHSKMIVYRYFLPKPNRDLTHIYLINQARLYIERQYPDYVWLSERQLLKQQAARPKAIKQKHITDGLIYRPDGRAIALEVERWDKAEDRLDAIMQELAQTYHRTWYFVSKKARTAVFKARAKLPEAERARIQVLYSEVKLLGQPDESEGMSEDLDEESDQR